MEWLGSVEDIVLRHSCRGMDVLRQYIEPDYVGVAASRLLAQERGTVLLATGFYVSGTGETDGPPGTLVLAEALSRLGFVPVILTDRYSVRFFDLSGMSGRFYSEITVNAASADSVLDMHGDSHVCSEESVGRRTETEQDRTEDSARLLSVAGCLSVECVALDAGEKVLQAVLDRMCPVAMISIERCGINVTGDYTNKKGASIQSFTAPIDRMFEMGRKRGIYTIGIGDGGNEIGMGCVQKEISRHLQLVPCRVETDALIIATVSNWGAYGLVAAMERQTGRSLMLPYGTVAAYIAELEAMGSVDGISGHSSCSVDGFGMETEREILDALREYVYKKTGMGG